LVSPLKEKKKKSVTLTNRLNIFQVIRTDVPKKPTKKHDPVSRFHQHQAEWKKDNFLARQKKGPSTTTTTATTMTSENKISAFNNAEVSAIPQRP
jgi:hypothetical protein